MTVVVHRGIPPVTARLIAVTLGLSLAGAIDARMGGRLYFHLALLPEAVWHGQLWRLVTWPFVMGGPLSLIYTCVVLYAFGTDLLLGWGRARYLRYLAGMVAAAGAGTSILALVLPDVWDLPQLGGMVLADVVVIAWARQFPHAPVRAYFLLVVQGPALVGAVVATTVLFAAYFGIAWMMPELVAVAAALVHGDRALRRWWLGRRLARVRRRLRVVRGGRVDDE